MNSPSVALSSFVPRLLYQRLVDGPPFVGAEQQSNPAAVLLSDIQGFTAMVERFVADGQAGLEALTATLNRYFVDLAEVVAAHGGDLLCIAGDAFVCHWPAATPFELGEATVRAAQAGLAVQARLHDRDAGRGLRFRTRLGIGAGALRLGFVGGVDGRWELTVSGRAFGDAAQAEKGAAPGAVVLSADAARLLGKRALGRSLSGGGLSLEAVEPGLPPQALPPRRDAAAPDQALRAFLPPAVLDRGLAHLDWLAELRQITVLMANLPELADASAASLERIDRGVRAFQQVVARFDGTVRVDVDDKGTMVLAAFGLPPRAHEDDAERAVRAGCALHEALAAMDLQCGIGIATGLVFCGVFGSDVRREYLVRGDVVNLAARLMQRQPAQLICDQATARAVRSGVAFEELPALPLAGIAQPVRVYRPTLRAAVAERALPPLVGRVVERAALAEQLAALQAGRAGRVTVLLGEAGIGKSRLLAEQRAQALAAGLCVLNVSAHAVYSGTSYHAWRPALRALLGLDADADAAAASVQLQAWLQADEMLRPLLPLLPLLGEALALTLPENALTSTMSGDVRAGNSRMLLQLLLLHQAGQRPTLLVVEDVHWMDSSSRALLLALAQRAPGTPGLAIAASLRPMGDQAPAEGAALLRLPQVEVLRLAALAADEIEALMRQRLGVQQLPAELCALVHERAEGHPFFCEELLHSLLESGHVRVAEGRCSVGDLGGLDLARSVEGVVLSRLDRLPPQQQLCLKVASVIGRAFRERAVCDMLPVAAERVEVPRQLQALSAIDVTVLRQPPPDPVYQFKHAIIRDVTYNLMPLTQRVGLHRAAAQWLEQEHRADLAPQQALLAHHWSHAQDPDRAAGHLERAGQQALRAGAFAEARSFFGQAIALERAGGVSADLMRRTLWDKGAGIALYFLGDLARSREHLERAVARLDRPLPRGPAALLRGLLAAAAVQAWHRMRPPFVAVADDDAQRVARGEAADCYRILGQIYYLDGEPAQRLAYVTVRGVNVGERAGASPALARSLSNMGTLCGLLGRPAWAQWYARRAVAMVEQEGQVSAAAYVWSINSLTAAQNGDWRGARAANAEALRRVQELRDFNLETEVWVVRSTVLLCEGNFAAAPEAWGKARELAQRHGNAQILCWTLLDEVDTLLGSGHTEAAATVLEQALAMPTADDDGGSRIDKLRATAMTRLRQHRFDEALRAADGVLEMIRRQPPTGYHWADYCASATEAYLVALSSGGELSRQQREPLLRRAVAAVKVLERLAATFGNVRPRSALLRGLLQLQQRQTGPARASLLRARQLALAMDMPYEHGRALLELGRLADGAERARLLDQAAALLAPLGALHALAQVDAVRQRYRESP